MTDGHRTCGALEQPLEHWLGWPALTNQGLRIDDDHIYIIGIDIDIDIDIVYIHYTHIVLIQSVYVI